MNHPLGGSSSLRFEQDEASRSSLLIAAVVAVLGRVRNKSLLHIATGNRVLSLKFDPAVSFNNLLLTASAGRGAPPVGSIAVDACIAIGALPEAQASFASDALMILAQKADDSVWQLSILSNGSVEDEDESLLLYISTLLESAVQDPQQLAGCLPLLNTQQALERYRSINATEAAYPQKTVQELVAEQTLVDPSASAVEFAGVVLSYRQVEEQSDRLAEILASMGADKEHPVALALPRSEQLPVVLLATLKAGSYFVPLDPTHPKQRLLSILEECRPSVVVVTAATSRLFVGHALPLLELSSTPLAGPSTGRHVSAAQGSEGALDEVAYTIYTSGTTGKPKGVIIPHRALVNYLWAAQREPGMKRGDRMLGVSTLSFDISLMDMFLPLITGATLVIADEQDAKIPAALAGLLQSKSITCMQATPVTWRMLITSGWQGRKKLRMFSGGEVLSRDLANTLLTLAEGGELWNCYGPTETTIYSSFIRVYAGEGPVPIGSPAANTSFYVADPSGKLLPPGVAGELYIGGAGVALGYFERPELSRSKFIPNPWVGDTQQRLFRTGDIARRRPDGSWEIFGRIDQQIKLRGFRIEPDEVEAVLRANPLIAEAAVVLREDTTGEPWLVAYVTPAAGSPEGTKLDGRLLRSHAAETLPGYMLPARFVTLNELPLTGSNKVDKRALQQLPPPKEITKKPEAKVPVDAVEATLLEVFREVLHQPSFGVDDDFFVHGGYSLQAVRLFTRIAQVFKKELSITSLFDAPTVRSLGALVRGSRQLAAVVPIRKEGNRPPVFMVHSYLLYGLAGNMVPLDHPILGLRELGSRQHDRVSLQESVSVYANSIQATYPEGPVHLAGWCAAAVLTIEVARRLQMEGRIIGLLALFDAEAPGFVPAPPRGNARVARLKAAMSYHSRHMQPLSWPQRFAYAVDRGKHMASRKLNRLSRSLPLLQGIANDPWNQQRGVEHRFPIASIDAKIDLFRATDVIQVPGSDVAMGWSSIARKGVDVTFVPGNHESMFLEPQFASLRREFAAALQRASATFVEDLREGDESKPMGDFFLEKSEEKAS